MTPNILNKKVLQILSRVAKNLQKKNVIKSKKKIVCTISGGQDSICLLIIFFLLRTQLVITFDLLFCQHFWQKESFFTMLHVAKCNFCCSTNIMFFLPLNQLISEKTARDWRHKSIQRTTLFYGYDVATQAHTKSDRIETILFNLIRGTGLTGVATLQFQCFQSLFSCNKFYPVPFHLAAFSTNLQLAKINNLANLKTNVSLKYAYYPTPPTCVKTLFLQDFLPMTQTFPKSKGQGSETFRYLHGINLKDIYNYLNISRLPLLHIFLYTYLEPTHLEPTRFKVLTIIANKKILKLVTRTKNKNNKVFFFRLSFYATLPINSFYYKRIWFRDTNDSVISKLFLKVKKKKKRKPKYLKLIIIS